MCIITVSTATYTQTHTHKCWSSYSQDTYVHITECMRSTC